jgi:hypothetical protein
MLVGQFNQNKPFDNYCPTPRKGKIGDRRCSVNEFHLESAKKSGVGVGFEALSDSIKPCQALFCVELMYVNLE